MKNLFSIKKKSHTPFSKRALASVVTTLAAGTLMINASTTFAANESMMIVFDASGSMWEKSGNRDRLTVAKGAVEQLLAAVPESVDIDMTVYGHRRKGDCADIEVLPGSMDRTQLNQRLQNITARGKTPLGAAIEKAAQRLADTDSQSRVVALTDGLETCGYDLCDLATTLKKTGVELVIDVVAFDIEEDVSSLQCLSDITGGTFYSARGFEGLAIAFDSIAAKSIVAEGNTERESAALKHPAKAELGDEFSVQVGAVLPDGKMYMLTVVPKNSPAKTLTEVNRMLQIGDIKSNGVSDVSMMLRPSILSPGEHEVRIVDMIASRVVVSTNLELYQPGQLSDSDKEVVVESSFKTAVTGGALVIEALDRVEAGRFLEFVISVDGDSSALDGFYTAQIVPVGTPAGQVPPGSNTTPMVINGKTKSMTMRVPKMPGNYELRLVKSGGTKSYVTIPVTAY